MTPVLCDSVARWQEVVPVAAALRNPVMQDRHWTKLQQQLAVMLPVGPAFTLQTLFDLKVSCHTCNVIILSPNLTCLTYTSEHAVCPLCMLQLRCLESTHTKSGEHIVHELCKSFVHVFAAVALTSPGLRCSCLKLHPF